LNVQIQQTTATAADAWRQVESPGLSRLAFQA